MVNPTSTGQQTPQTIMPFVSGPGANIGPSTTMQTPMLGGNVQVAQPQPARPVSTPEAVMMQALMRRLNN